MTIDEYGEYTLSLLRKYLPHNYKEWDVEFFSSESIAGQCFLDRKIIQISLYIINKCTQKQIEDVIKHEVAHAIAVTTDNKCRDHGPLWREVCYYIGCSAELTCHVYLNNNSTTSTKNRINPNVYLSKNENAEDVDLSLVPW